MKKLDSILYLDDKLNRQVLEYIKDKSAHTDIAEVLVESVKPLGDVQIYCPDYKQYKYICVSTKGIIFGFAIGMHTMAFRLDRKMKDRAIATGGRLFNKCGDEWIEVMPKGFDSDWPSVDVKFWALKSYVYARNIARQSGK